MKRTLHHQSQRLTSKRFWLLAAAHTAVFALVYWMAFLLRFDGAVPEEYRKIFLSSLPWILARNSSFSSCWGILTAGGPMSPSPI